MQTTCAKVEQHTHGRFSFNGKPAALLTDEHLSQHQKRSLREAPITYKEGHLVQRDHLSWRHVDITVDDVHCDDRLSAEIVSDATTIHVVLDVVGGRLDVKDSQWSQRSLNQESGPISLIPTDHEAHALGQPLKFVRHLFVQIDDDHFQAISEANRRDPPLLLPKLMFTDTRVASICQLLAQECRSSQPAGTMFGENLANALIVALAGLPDPSTAAPSQGGLAAWQLRRSQAFMLENISQQVSLSSLADQVGFSVTHFSRAFKASTGKTPYKWVLDERISMAKSYLLTGSMHIAEIAARLGFCDQSHFTRTFRLSTGMSPRNWQRAYAAM